jgi:hypothetical protein
MDVSPEKARSRDYEPPKAIKSSLVAADTQGASSECFSLARKVRKGTHVVTIQQAGEKQVFVSYLVHW